MVPLITINKINEYYNKKQECYIIQGISLLHTHEIGPVLYSNYNRIHNLQNKKYDKNVSLLSCGANNTCIE
ncbi:hypothetical protein A3Q56_08234 [Intoshia linei]|uniref:Uncharacterized protein n=1 Tax=Intoshia linei TaxID=1819745 RepID=A0A177AQI0_9BILA|nr:hypothetical protein A3Q56_08234 [Intoshia linei]